MNNVDITSQNKLLLMLQTVLSLNYLRVSHILTNPIREYLWLPPFSSIIAHPEASSVVFLDLFRLWAVGTLLSGTVFVCLSSFSCNLVRVFYLKLGLHSVPLQHLYLFYDLPLSILLFVSYVSSVVPLSFMHLSL
jgi:hypothetical protein